MNLREFLERIKVAARTHNSVGLNRNDPVVAHLDSLLHEIRNQGIKLMATNDELLADVKAVQAQVAKISSESSASLAKITELEAALASQPGGTSPEVDAAMAELKASVQAVDDLVSDGPVTEEPTEEPVA